MFKAEGIYGDGQTHRGASTPAAMSALVKYVAFPFHCQAGKWADLCLSLMRHTKKKIMPEYTGQILSHLFIHSIPMNFLTPEWHDQLASTNTHLLQHLSQGERLSSGFVLAAREQTAGRGRYQREWIARTNENLTFSFLLITKAAFPQLASLPIAIALGVSDALKTYGIRTRTKWPNDVLIDRAKICGMLLERSDHKQLDGTAIIIGIGLNVNMDAATAVLIDRPVTSMRLETGREYDLEHVLAQVLSSIAPSIDRWEREGFAVLRTAWEHRCVYIGEQISVGEGDDMKTGVLAGFGDCGQLLLRGPDGRVSEIWAGDVAAI